MNERPAHSNAPRRAQLVLAFVGIVLAGVLGGTIGWGIVDTTCSEDPTVAEQLLDDVPGYDVDTASCDVALLGGALGGALLAAVGAAVIAVLVLRAQSEWRAHPPRPAGGPPGRPSRPVTPAGSGGNPRRT